MKPTAVLHASRLGALAALAALTVAGGPAAWAQPAPSPTGVTLTCRQPTSTDNVVEMNTDDEGTWGISTDLAPAIVAASAYNYGPPWIAGPATWIGGISSPAPETVTYTLPVNANDPNIVLNSVRINYSYVVDNHVDSITWNTTPLPYSDATSFEGPAASYSNVAVPLVRGANTLTFVTNNQLDPHGLNAAVSLSFNCAPPVVNSVPVDNPWALASLAAALGVAGAGLVRRRKKA